ncbi:MAG: hypothetical protein JKX81_00045 [Arenicella sp.]|nr:hypothetical protein [Arenicella sp.]
MESQILVELRKNGTLLLLQFRDLELNPSNAQLAAYYQYGSDSSTAV